QCADADKHVRDFLTIRSDILNRRASGMAGDSAQALDAAESPVNTCRGHFIPVFTRGGAQMRSFPRHALQSNSQDKSIESAIGNQKVRSTAQNKDWNLPAFRIIKTVENILFRRGV